MTVGINTEAINHKNIPFTMYDLGWVVLCIGAAIGSGIVFFPLQVGLKGVWVFATAVIWAIRQFITCRSCSSKRWRAAMSKIPT